MLGNDAMLHGGNRTLEVFSEQKIDCILEKRKLLLLLLLYACVNVKRETHRHNKRHTETRTRKDRHTDIQTNRHVLLNVKHAPI